MSKLTPNTDHLLADNVVRELLSVLKPVASKWYQIGLALKIEASQLHTVESDLRASPTHVDNDKHLEEVLRLRLEAGKPTWKQVVQALFHVNETELAEQVIKEHGKAALILPLRNAHTVSSVH